MALVNVVNMVVLDNPTCFLNPFQFEITFECLQELEDDLEWKVLYVGSAHDSHKDQVLDEILVGPVPVGLNKFVLQADAPDPGQLPPDELLGVTVVLVTCSYQEREFVRVGYYVNNEYTEPQYLAAVAEAEKLQQQQQQQQAQQQQEGGTDAPPAASSSTEENAIKMPTPPLYPNLDMKYVQRQILADKPRVTKFPISWGKENNDPIMTEATAAAASEKTGFGGAGMTNGTPSTSATSPPGSPMQMD